MPNTVYQISLTTDAGVSQKIKTGGSPLRIYDTQPFHTVQASEPVSSRAIRTKNKVPSVAGVLRTDPIRTFSYANPY